ncbi:RNB domain-containing ribonuclease [Streptomyces sp. MS1.AVA.3]|uniref:RNB domain-containing ribonuclease n=1 Tax=Streptomyces decoyicus TaxID=249567 RepID=UPI0030C45204
MSLPVHDQPSSPTVASPVMIDRKGSVDRDDAIAVRRLDDGWELTVYVADVASGVARNSATDREALRRRESAYGGRRGTAKMLPRPVEERLTLAQGRPCAAMRVRVKVAADGTARHSEVGRATLQDSVAMDHQEVADAIIDLAHPLHGPLREAAALSEVLLARRRDQGALALYDLLRGWATDEDGGLVQLETSERNVAYKVVQECMIAANTALAAWAAERDLPLLFRNHSVAKVAPPRQVLLEDFGLALADGSPARLEALQQRTLMVMKAAEYAPFMGGHWGLNLPGYVHATSPLRRYADLVVQRVVFHYLDGAEAPYTPDELALIAAALNNGARADREAQKDSFKRAAHARDRRAAATDADYSPLDSRAFHAVLKRGCKENITTASLADEAARRAVAQQLTALELQLLLLVAAGQSWEGARVACLETVSAAPETAVSVLSVHAQINGLPLAEFTDGSEGQSPHTVFSSSASLTIDGRHVSGATRTASTKRAARHQAAVSLLARLAELPDPSQNLAASAPRTNPKATATSTLQGLSPLMTLNEYAQVHVISGLTFDITGQGPSHMPIFTCNAQAHCEGEQVTGTSSAPSKAAAKTKAAVLLLKAIDTRRQQAHGAE